MVSKAIYFFVFIFLLVFIFKQNFFSYQKNFKKQKLYIYSYSSFINQWGAGAAIKKEFEKICNCSVLWIRAGDSRMLLRRMQLLKKDTIDLVIGLDQFSMLEAKNLFKWRAIKLKNHWVKPITKMINNNNLVGSYFIPYDWSPMGFIYKKDLKIPPKSFSDLLKPRFQYKIALQNPVTSSPGLQFLMAVNNHFPKPKRFFTKLRKNVKQISNSWSKSYTLFKAGHKNLVFSYLSSLAYHAIEENNFNYKMAIFKKPHPYQVEMMAIPNFCTNCLLAKKMVKFILSPKIQKIIMYKNFMFPVIKTVSRGSVFAQLPQPRLVDYKMTTQNIQDSLALYKKYFLNK